MFERYTEGARRVIFFARYEAAQYGSPWIETEHMLLGLMRQEPELVRRTAPSASPEAIRSAIDEHVSPGEKISTSVDLPLSNACKRVLAYAAEEAERAGSRPITVGHLLLGLLREEESRAAKILRRFGAGIPQTRALTGSPTGGHIALYCPNCAREVTDPLTCGDCSAVICRVCGTPLETPEDLGIG